MRRTSCRAAIENFVDPLSEINLPSSPPRFIELTDEEDGPQPARHVTSGNGMTVTVGRIKRCPNLGIRLVGLVHNTIRGAAGGALLNAEFLIHRGFITGE